jgi:hypothetical protein
MRPLVYESACALCTWVVRDPERGEREKQLPGLAAGRRPPHRTGVVERGARFVRWTPFVWAGQNEVLSGTRSTTDMISGSSHRATDYHPVGVPSRSTGMCRSKRRRWDAADGGRPGRPPSLADPAGLDGDDGRIGRARAVRGLGRRVDRREGRSRPRARHGAGPGGHCPAPAGASVAAGPSR